MPRVLYRVLDVHRSRTPWDLPSCAPRRVTSQARFAPKRVKCPPFAQLPLSAGSRAQTRRIFACNAILPREHFRSLAHDQARKRVLEAIAIHRINERKVAHAMTPAGIGAVDEIRHPTHRSYPRPPRRTRTPRAGCFGQPRQSPAFPSACLVDRLRRLCVGAGRPDGRPGARDSDRNPPAARAP